MNVRESVTLRYKEGSSDKVYQAQLNETPDGFTVTFAYGRYGSALKDGVKTAAPVDFDKAKKIYDRLVAEKMAKGYTPGSDGIPFSGSSTKERSDLPVQLLNPIEESEVEMFCVDPDYLAQEKYDGERRLLVRCGDTVREVNRKGLYVAPTTQMVEAARRIPIDDFVLDGELVGDTLHVFDLLRIDGENIEALPYWKRLDRLDVIFNQLPNRDVIVPVPSALTAESKRDLVESVGIMQGEGVVFKQFHAPYSAGRPASGGPQRKHKFFKTSSVVVTAISSGKRSVAMSVYDGAVLVDVGNVQIPPNHPVPPVGAVIEVRYLNAARGGSLFQPTYLGVRDDLDATDCVISQLHFKPGPVDRPARTVAAA